MLKYFLKRIVSSIITIFMIITITFFLMKAIPGNPFADEKMPNPEIRAAMMEKYGRLSSNTSCISAILSAGISACPIPARA